jgi:glycyl-tRNA synthetase alpha chain
MLLDLFNQFEKECNQIISKGLTMPAYDYVLKCSHVFNLLDARGAISVTERTNYIKRVRDIAKSCAQSYLKSIIPMDEKSGGLNE